MVPISTIWNQRVLHHSSPDDNPVSQNPDEAPLAVELTILMPCLNEAETIEACISKAKGFFERSDISGEVVIADNGSEDGSVDIASRAGARVVHVARRGYGEALRAGIDAARGRYIIMGDADSSYDFGSLDDFVAKLREGYDLVMGNRFKGGIEPGAMPMLHRYLGNPVLSGIGRLLFNSPVRDFHCGLRGFNRDSIRALNLRTSGMEFASEMVVRSTVSGLQIAEVPTTLAPDGRTREPHLRSWRDGWRHLRFLLIYSPGWLFLYPGLLMIAVGLAATLLVLPGPLKVGSMVFDVHTLIAATSLMIVGVQVLLFFILAKQYAARAGILPLSPRFQRFLSSFSLEKAILSGAAMFVLGLVGMVYAVVIWSDLSFGDLRYTQMMRLVVPAVTLLAIGVQVTMAGFLASLMTIEVK